MRLKKVTSLGSAVMSALRLSMGEPIDMIARPVTTSHSVRSATRKTQNIHINSRRPRCQWTKAPHRIART
jgi:hypothetical protein